jgi:PIN domain nuclease of toxin-antitoxin system
VTSPPVLDTHAWVWWIERNPRLGERTVSALDQFPSHGRPYLSDISLWEIAMLVERERVHLTIPLREWLAAAADDRKVQRVRITPAIAAETAALPETFHRDPADRLIVATCLTLGAPLLSRDRLITRSKLVPLWRPAA